MTKLKISEQIAFLRKQRGLTQEELAQALGVTNQAVSKWESAQCCPDIQLLPDIAGLFEVSVDELLGYKTTDGLGDICVRLKDYFTALPENASFTDVYRIAALLHEIAVTDGYKKSIPWKAKDYSSEPVSAWGLSILSEVEGSTVRNSGTIMFSNAASDDGISDPDAAKIREIMVALRKLSDMDTLKVLYSLHSLTNSDFDLYAGTAEISERANLSIIQTEAVLENIPLTVKEENGELRYRLDGAFSHIPPLLTLFGKI